MFEFVYNLYLHPLVLEVKDDFLHSISKQLLELPF